MSKKCNIKQQNEIYRELEIKNLRADLFFKYCKIFILLALPLAFFVTGILGIMSEKVFIQIFSLIINSLS